MEKRLSILSTNNVDTKLKIKETGTAELKHKENAYLKIEIAWLEKTQKRRSMSTENCF